MSQLPKDNEDIPLTSTGRKLTGVKPILISKKSKKIKPNIMKLEQKDTDPRLSQQFISIDEYRCKGCGIFLQSDQKICPKCKTPNHNYKEPIHTGGKKCSCKDCVIL